MDIKHILINPVALSNSNPLQKVRADVSFLESDHRAPLNACNFSCRYPMKLYEGLKCGESPNAFIDIKHLP